MSPSGNALTLTNITPGDKVILDIDMDNESNVDIQYRVRAYSTVLAGYEGKNLFSSLKFDIDGFDYSGVEAISTPWQVWNAGDEPSSTFGPISIYLPLTKLNELQENGTSITFVLEAVQANAYVKNETSDSAFVNSVNKKLVREELDFPTLALDKLTPGDVDDLLEIENLVWNSKYNLFGINYDGVIDYANCEISPDLTEDVWVFTDTYVAGNNPIYLTGTNTTGILNISTSLDCGSNKDIETVNYVNHDEPKSVVIRTCSDNTTLVVDAPNDTVKHYDKANHVVVESVAMHSYHEFGQILGNITLNAGNVVVEEGCSASAVVIDLTAEELATVTTIAADNTQEPEVPIILNTTNYAWSVNDNNSLIDPDTNNIIYTKSPAPGKETSTSPEDMVDYGALVDSTGYPTFKEAVAACGNGQTIRLLKDYKYATSPSYVYTTKARYTIDLNGHTLDFNDSGYGLYLLKGQTVTLNDSEGNGCLKNRQCVVYMLDGSNLIINGGRIGGVDKDQATIYGYGSLTINGGCIESAYKNNYAYYSVMIGNYSNNNTPASFVMTGGKLLGSIYVSGNDTDNNIIRISGGSISGSNYIAGKNTTTITGGTFTGVTCFYFKAGTINISGGTFTSIRGDGDWQHKDSSCTNTGDAVIFEGCGYPNGSPTAHITGGTFNAFKPEGGTEPTSGNIYFKNYGILVINYGGETVDMTGTTVSYALAEISDNTDPNYVTSNGYIHFTDDNVTIIG